MNRRLVIHIGLRKTGSSALQEILAKETDTLMTHGIDYPARLCRFPAHQELAWSLVDPLPPYWENARPKDEVYDHFCKVIDDNVAADRTTLISSEDLSLLTLDFSAMEYLKSRLGSYDPLIVYYQRDPVEYLISNYKHAIVAGREIRDFSKYVFNVSTMMFADSRMIRRVWSSVFGDNNVRKLYYSRERLNQTSIFCDFLKTVFDVEVPDEYQTYRSNSGVPDEAVDYLLSMNRSDLPDEKLKRLKQVVRQAMIPSDNEAFLKRHLTEDQISVVRKIFS